MEMMLIAFLFFSFLLGFDFLGKVVMRRKENDAVVFSQKFSTQNIYFF